MQFFYLIPILFFFCSVSLKAQGNTKDVPPTSIHKEEDNVGKHVSRLHFKVPLFGFNYDVDCTNQQQMTELLSKMRAAIVEYTTSYNLEHLKMINRDLLNSKLNLFLDNPSKESFDELFLFLKKSTLSYILLTEEPLIQKLSTSFDQMKMEFGKHIEIVDGMFDASKHLVLRKWAVSQNKNKDFKLEFEENGMSMEHEIILTIPVKGEDLLRSYDERSVEFQNLDYAAETFHFSLTIFSAFLRYTFPLRKLVYCTSYGYFPGVKTFTPVPSSSNPTSSRIAPYYQLRLLGIIKYINHKKKARRQPRRIESSLKCKNVPEEIHKQPLSFLEGKIHNILFEFISFFHSIGIETELTREDYEYDLILGQNYARAHFHKSFVALLGIIPNEYNELKVHLKQYYYSFSSFFEEAEKAFSNLEKYNDRRELKKFKSTSSQGTFFQLLLKPNGVFFAEWGPVVDLNIIYDAMGNSEDEEYFYFLRQLYLFTESLLEYQELHIRYMFLEMWRRSCLV
ncbi:hypothetical protein HMI54_007856 [Coelomomyces lativittatus]|nr:hypothetical protein HMI56_003135 [Coelomomyces lativittatus]KAJ1503689.1 hypothetical protein HMI54_007856 [Coelomomyces lativittatus]KAJ1517248.1 hypothetical protein HMI55_000270 [Coelomomyces lativittatus]